LHGDHQHQGLLQSKDIEECCFFNGNVKRWLKGLDCFPENYFELWDIYDEYSGDNGRRVMERLHEAKDEDGKSIKNLDLCEKLHAEKNKEGKSIHAVKMGKKGGKKGGNEGVRRRSGIHDPAYRSSEEYIQMRKEESKKYADRKEGMFDPGFKQKLKQKLSKPLTFHHPDGQSVTFPSRMEAIRQTNISSSTLVRVLLSGEAIKAGPFKGVRITEAEG
jgi:hypothetical protein